MTRSAWIWLGLGAALLVLLLSGAAFAQPLATGVRVTWTGPIVDPDWLVWTRAPAITVPLTPQVITTPHKADAAVRELTVRVVHNGGWIAFHLEWKDPTRSDTIVLDSFGDQVAVQLPISKGTPPSPMMGHPGGRVNIMQWRAAFQRDLEKGPPTVKSLYPFAWVDVYPDEILGVADARPYAGALGLENPISRGVASPVLDQMAEGWGSMTAKPDQRALGKGVWGDGTWRVVISRPMVGDDPNAPVLLPGDQTVMAFAAWEGGNGEVGARKSWSGWIPLLIQK
jgi:hypothetical protein